MKCSTCNKSYTGTNHARLLPCDHCICQSCLASIKDRSKKVCKLCDNKSWANERNVSQFPTVYNMISGYDSNSGSGVSSPHSTGVVEYGSLSGPAASTSASNLPTDRRGSDASTNINDERDCELCKEEYDDLGRAPCLLSSCGHAFCYNCLQEIENRSDNKTCPKCRQSWQTEVSKLRRVRDLIRNKNVGRGETMRRSLKTATPKGVKPESRVREYQNTQMDEPQQVFVRDATRNKTVTIDISDIMTVDDLRREIESRLSIPGRQQQLLFEGHSLNMGKRTLADCGIRNNSTINLTCRMHGG